MKLSGIVLRLRECGEKLLNCRPSDNDDWDMTPVLEIVRDLGSDPALHRLPALLDFAGIGKHSSRLGRSPRPQDL